MGTIFDPEVMANSPVELTNDDEDPAEVDETMTTWVGVAGFEMAGLSRTVVKITLLLEVGAADADGGDGLLGARSLKAFSVISLSFVEPVQFPTDSVSGEASDAVIETVSSKSGLADSSLVRVSGAG